jgi:hypothetical protein
MRDEEVIGGLRQSGSPPGAPQKITQVQKSGENVSNRWSAPASTKIASPDAKSRRSPFLMNAPGSENA